jgi:hypothetical protein
MQKRYYPQIALFCLVCCLQSCSGIGYYLPSYQTTKTVDAGKLQFRQDINFSTPIRSRYDDFLIAPMPLDTNQPISPMKKKDSVEIFWSWNAEIICGISPNAHVGITLFGHSSVLIPVSYGFRLFGQYADSLSTDSHWRYGFVPSADLVSAGRFRYLSPGLRIPISYYPNKSVNFFITPAYHPVFWSEYNQSSQFLQGWSIAGGIRDKKVTVEFVFGNIGLQSIFAFGINFPNFFDMAPPGYDFSEYEQK